MRHADETLRLIVHGAYHGGMDAIPLYPPRDWFTPPADMARDAGCVVEDSGRVYGYLCHWGSVLMDGTGDRWKPPRSRAQYAYAHTGDTKTAEGETLRTANLGGGAGHAPVDGAGPGRLEELQDFYANTSTQLARVRYGEDEHGVWFAGALWPDVSELDVARLRASARSGHWAAIGDWRDMSSGKAGYELVGACLVNVPGLKYARADRAASGVLMLSPALRPFDADHDGAMVALYPPAHVAEALAVEGGEPASDLHITLAFFEDAAAARDDWDAIHALVANIGARHLPLSGVIAGRGEFNNGDGVVHWASPDVPGLAELRHDLVAGLNDAGFTVRADHGFTPHITLRYDEAPGQDPPDVETHELELDRLTLAVGGDMTELTAKASPLSSESHIDMAAAGTVELAVAEEGAAAQKVGGVLVIEGEQTEDGRLIEAGATEWRDLPLPLYSALRNRPGHDDADLVGTIETITRSGNSISWTGLVQPGAMDGAGQETIDAIGEKRMRGISIDGIAGPDDVYWGPNDETIFQRIVVAGATLTPMPAIAGADVTLMSADTEGAGEQLEMAVDNGDTTDTEDEVVDDQAEQNSDTDAIAALDDKITALQDDVTRILAMLENAELTARAQAALRTMEQASAVLEGLGV